MPFLRSLQDGSLEVMPDCMMPLHGECVVEAIATDLCGFRRADSH
jgi:acyl CoA:acetate/3-ketoacid CoA transferase beta subunit